MPPNPYQPSEDELVRFLTDGAQDRDYRPMESIRFEKRAAGKISQCVVETYSDSAYVEGDDIGQLIFEWANDAIAQAIAYVESRGYVRL